MTVNINEYKRVYTPRSRASPRCLPGIFDCLCNAHAREIRENVIARDLIDDLLQSEFLGSHYRALHGIWHSEGTRLALVPESRGWPAIEIFFFEHGGGLPWSMKMRIHTTENRQMDSRWHTEELTEEGARRDLACQLFGALVQGGAPLPK